ncbi:MAG: hypothetical protein H6700_11190 [Myxococcales bacterium]|nr:hypothetical protein [Myxococcales bacterium]
MHRREALCSASVVGSGVATAEVLSPIVASAIASISAASMTNVDDCTIGSGDWRLCGRRRRRA